MYMTSVTLPRTKMEYKKPPPTSLSEVLRKRLNPGQEDQFWDKRNAIILDTSFLVSFFEQRKLWTFVAVAELDKLHPYFLVLPPRVASELHGLEQGNKPDYYGNPLITRALVNDLWPKDVRLQITFPEEFDNRIVQMWTEESQKYRRYKEHPEDYDKEPVIDAADVEVIKYALARADRNLPSHILSGDTDILDTAEGFHYHEKLPIYAARPKGPDDWALEELKLLDVLFLENVIADVRNARPGQYVLFARNTGVTEKRSMDVGFEVVDNPTSTKQIYSAVIVDNEDDLNSLLDEYPRVVLNRGKERLPGLAKTGTLLVSRGKIIDPLGVFKEITIDEYLETHFGMSRKNRDWALYRTAIGKLGNIHIIRAVQYMSVDERYLQRHMPILFEYIKQLSK